MQSSPGRIPDRSQKGERVRRRHVCQPSTFAETFFGWADRRRHTTVLSIANGGHQVVDSLQGTEINADSFGQGLLENNRAHLAWLDSILTRYPDLIVENCGSGGGRMDYAMLSQLRIQSMTDQENYLKLPAILVGASAAVLPEQLAIWSFCKRSALEFISASDFSPVTW